MKKSLFAALMLSATALITVPTAGIAAPKENGAHNVVLVHGAFADESSWNAVAAILSKEGYNVTQVKNPLTSLDADVAATKSALAAQDGKTVLVGHSWGGVVIGEAGDDAKVSALVYVSAFAPDKGETLGALAKGGEPTEGLKAIVPDAKGFLSVDQKAFPAVFAADLPKAEAEKQAANQLPINHTAFDAVTTVAAWHQKPTWFVISGEDKMIAPQAQNFFAGRMKAKTVTVAGSHASLISHAAEVAAVIEEAAGQ